MECPHCAGRDLGEIRFAFAESGLRFNYCRRCEHRWWEGSSKGLRLDDVLEAATVLARAS